MTIDVDMDTCYTEGGGERAMADKVVSFAAEVIADSSGMGG